MNALGLSPFLGNALEITHHYRPLCMTFATFSYILLYQLAHL